MEKKYNRIMPECEGNVFCAEIGSKVTLSEYQTVFEPRIKEIFSEYESARALLVYSEPSVGWDLDAAAHDFDNMTRLGKNIDKVALVNPPEPVKTRWLTLKPLVGGEVKIFEADQMQEALDWVKF